jgi:hypothetical protein
MLAVSVVSGPDGGAAPGSGGAGLAVAVAAADPGAGAGGASTQTQGGPMLASGLVPQPRRLGFALVLESADVGARAAAHVTLAGGRVAAAKLAALAHAAAEGEGATEAEVGADTSAAAGGGSGSSGSGNGGGGGGSIVSSAAESALASARRQKAALCA